MKIFCSGIGGIGMSAYAAYQHACSHEISGSEVAWSVITAALQAQGIPISLVQDGSAVPLDADLFVYTLALPQDHAERRRAQELGLPARTYFQALGQLTDGSGKRLIAVCGTHGKSTTTAMAAKMLIEAGLDPAVILGTRSPDLHGRNWRKGGGEWFLVEACEYHRSFLHLSPEIILLTNVDGDHFDAFADSRDYQKAFQEFIAKLPSDGVLVAHCTDHGLQPILNFAKEKSLHIVDADTFSSPPLKVPGQHMQENAQLVLALADVLAIDRTEAESSLRNYEGAWRRMEILGEIPPGVIVIDDYGHHPREVAATLQALRGAYPHRRLICVFQPHTHDRTRKFYGAFSGAFKDADIVIVPNIYDARPHADSTAVDVATFVHDVAKVSGTEAFHGQSLEQTAEILRSNILQRNDLLVTMGAGDVWRVAQQLTIHP
jgi:UDP-N-acetylmuramate--alanine ligase